MKRIVASLFIGLISAMLLATYTSASTANEVREDVLRLHILANSDSKEDQQLKIKVRDALLLEAGELFCGTVSKEESVKTALLNLARLKEIAEREIRKNGYSYTVEISVTESFFPTKEYESGYRLPAGYYDALKVEIGKAQGKNWWCILYPPLCFGGAVAEGSELNDVLNNEQLSFVTSSCPPDMQVKFKLAELWGEFINKLQININR